MKMLRNWLAGLLSYIGALKLFPAPIFNERPESFDPFGAFTEWAGEIDERSYRDL